MYKSFVTCDDPKGVVECGTIINSKKMEENIKTQRPQKNATTLMAYKPRKEEMVHRGIVEELLKGALDLQESLAMIGKLQEASQYMAQLKKKQKEKLENRRIDEVGSEKTSSHQSADENHQLGFQKPADGSSKDGIKELRNVVRDSLGRQNLLPIQEKQHFDRRIGLILDAQKSQSTDIHSTSSSKSQTVLQKKGKSSNLIAKLMGLEDFPSKPLLQAPEKQLDTEKNLVQQRAETVSFAPEPVMKKVNSERTLKEIIETVQFQGLLKDGSAKELKWQSRQSSNFNSKERFINRIQPIVLIKPLSVPRLESEEALSPMNTEMMLEKLKIKRGFAHRLIDNREGISSSNAKEMHCETEANETAIEKEEGAKDQIEVFVIPEEKEVRIIDLKEETVAVKKGDKKLEAEKAPVKGISHEEREKFKGAVSIAEEKEIKTKLKDSSKMKGCNSATYQQQRKEMIDKKVDKIQKVVANSTKPVERETLKTKKLSGNQDQVKLISAKLKKPENGSKRTTTTRKNNSKVTTQTTVHNFKGRNQKEKQVTENTTAQPIIDNLKCKVDEKKIDLTCNSQSVADQLSMEEEAKAPKFPTEGKLPFSSNQNSICIVTKRNSEYEKSPKSFKEEDDQMICIKSDGTSFTSGNQLKNLLLSSPSFLNLAEELFHLNSNYANFYPKSGMCDSPVTDIKLSLDYANEFIKRRSLPDSQTRTPLLSFTEISRIHLSLDQLVDEICSGDEILRSYRKLTSEKLQMYATMERDLKCKGVVSGTWDLGWRNGFTVEEVEQAGNELENLILNELIEEVLL